MEGMTVHFTGKLLDGTLFASSRENDIPLIFKLTKDDVMEGFRLAITSMQAGEKAVFTIPHAWAVTKSGCLANIPWNIPPNQTLRFDIELISLITDIFGDQGVMKKTIKFGNGSKLPLNHDEVLVKYSACLEDGALVSESEGVEFSPAEGFFCSAFAPVVKTMTKGEEAIVVIKPEYAFGERGRAPTGNETVVPTNATLHVNLQLISWKIVTSIGQNREIVKRRLCEGNGEVPRNGAVVEVRLIGKLQDGTVFDCKGHNADDPFKFTINKEPVVYGLHEAVMNMMEGEVASFTIPPQHAFGAIGSNQYPLAVIPPDSVVTYEIELLSVVNEEVEEEGDGMFHVAGASIGRIKYRDEAREGRIFVPPLARLEANSSRAVSAAPTISTPGTPEASPVGSASNDSSTIANENQRSGKASLLRSCFGFPSSD